MTNTPERPERAEAIAHLHAVRATMGRLTELYAKPRKTTDEWAQISELRTLVKAGHDAAQINAILALEAAVVRLAGTDRQLLLHDGHAEQLQRAAAASWDDQPGQVTV